MHLAPWFGVSSVAAAPGRAGGSITHPIALDQLEAHDVLQLAQADGAGLQRPQQGLVQAQRTLHDALQPAARPQAHQVADLVASHLAGRQKSEQQAVIPASLSLPLPSPLWQSNQLGVAILQPWLFQGEHSSLLPRYPAS